MSWNAALRVATLLFVSGKNAYTIKKYHDKVKKLGGGKPEKLGDKDAKVCVDGTMQKAVTNATKVLNTIRAIESEKYAIPETNSAVLWGKMAAAFGKFGKDSKEFKGALKTYLGELRYLDKELGKQIAEIKDAKPIIEAQLASSKAYTKYAQTLEKYFMLCAKVPSLSAWQARFFSLSRDCATFSSKTKSLETVLAKIVSGCKANLPVAQATKKQNLEWIAFYEKTEPKDEAQMKKNAKAKRPKK